ncbi:nitrous oxide reductase accessory protein NosL [Pontibacter sp. KCTC 32443]|uniref:nitrous oxide reductase accessory protein NosL n=1 Tax=Pontibacter TaxID=323449 RepID=UPI00164D7156|nr:MULTISPECIES: nitrous oxide reductase accessory protein NosL [Pontibacter]MBC5774736.1 nitrous oxide reductase accessory protein NosL [Pontibacter sp. KCTC 32443]
MKPVLKIVGLLFILSAIVSCKPEQKPIPYGAANCAHCNMTVADNRYGAELVNDKGKAFFFDSSECLMAYVNEQTELAEKASFILVSDFTKPGELIDARKAHYLQSKNLPSPMGLYLTAVADKTAATKMHQEHGGRLLTWNEAVTAVKNNEKPE